MMKAFKNSGLSECCVLKSRGTAVGSSRFVELIMTHSRAELASLTAPLWFCLRTQRKHEHCAAVGLRRQLQVACFSPRLRYRKATRRGAVWFVEAMFPGYLFAEFVYSRQHRQVEYSPGIQGVVRFGDQVAALDSSTIANLRQAADEKEVVTFNPEIQVGQAVGIAEG